jgi:hypothetical protein
MAEGCEKMVLLVDETRRATYTAGEKTMSM